MLNNLAAHCAQGLGAEELVLWNSDLWAPDAETFPRLLEAHRAGGHTITGTRLLYPPRSWDGAEEDSVLVRRCFPGAPERYRGTVQFGGSALLFEALAPGLYTYLPRHAHRFAAADDPRVCWDGPEVFVTGAFAIVDLAWWVQTGGLRTGFQDEDLCLRAAEQGRKVAYLGRSGFLWHDEAVTHWCRRGSGGRRARATCCCTRRGGRPRGWPACSSAWCTPTAWWP